MEEISKLLKERCHLTGSRKFGINKKDSDYDYFTDVHSFDDILGVLKENDIDYTKAPYFKGIYFRLDNKTINLICLSVDHLKNWVFATESIKAMCKDEGLKEIISIKANRVYLFEILCNANRYVGY